MCPSKPFPGQYAFEFFAFPKDLLLISQKSGKGKRRKDKGERLKDKGQRLKDKSRIQEPGVRSKDKGKR
jgi:hypothetical protein